MDTTTIDTTPAPGAPLAPLAGPDGLEDDGAAIGPLTGADGLEDGAAGASEDEPYAHAYPYVLEYQEAHVRAMSEHDARAYFKTHSVAGDARFMLAPGRDLPADLRASWEALSGAIDGRNETATDRKTAAALRDAWRTYADGKPYALPIIDTPKPRKAKRAGVCPRCGRSD